MSSNVSWPLQALCAGSFALGAVAGGPVVASGSAPEPALRWVAGSEEHIHTESWSTVARAPGGDVLAAVSTKRTRDSVVLESSATLQRIAVDGTATLLPLHDRQGRAVVVGGIDALAVAPTGMIFAAERERRVILAITPQGEVRVLAGRPNPDGTIPAHDGDSGSAVFVWPERLAVDARGDLWVVDGRWVRVVTAQGNVRTFRGYAEAAVDYVWLGDEPPDPDQVRFDGLGSTVFLAADAHNAIWILTYSSPDLGGLQLYRVDEGRTLQPVAMPAYPAEALYPKGSWEPVAFTVGPDGSLFLVNEATVYSVNSAYAVWRLEPDQSGVISGRSLAGWVAGVVRTLYGTPQRRLRVDRSEDLPAWPPDETNIPAYGPADGDIRRWPGPRGGLTYLPSIDSLAVQADGTLLAAFEATQLLRIRPGGQVEIAADLDPGRRDVASPLASRIKRAVMAADGSVFYIDRANLWRIAPDGRETRIVRLAIERGDLDDPPGRGMLSDYHSPADLLLDPEGNILVAEPYTGLIRRITPQGEVGVVTGTRANAGPRPLDGDRMTATLGSPQRLAMDSAGRLYVLDRSIRHTIDRGWGGSIRRVDLATGAVTTVARAGDRRAIEDSGGYADIAIGKDDQLLVLDEDGAVWAVDHRGHHTLRMRAPPNLVRPKELAADREGNIYLGSIGTMRDRNSAVVRIDASGTARIVASPAGAGGRQTATGISGLGAMRLTPQGDLLLVLGSWGGNEQGVRWDPRVRNLQLPMDHNDSASGIAVLTGLSSE